jgi:hypothetical protein
MTLYFLRMLKYEIEEYAQDFDLFPAIETLA